MEIQTTMCLSPQQLAIIPFDQNSLHISNQPPKPDDINHPIDDLPSFRQRLFSDVKEEFKRRYTMEQLVASTYLWVLKVTSFSHLALAFELLEEKTGLSKSVSPIVMSFFKYSLAMFASISMAYADVNCRMLRTSSILKNMGLMGTSLGLPLAYFFTMLREEYRGIIVCTSDIMFMSCTGSFDGYGKYGWLLNFGLYLLTLTIGFPIGFRAKLSSGLVLAISILGCSFRAAGDLELLSTLTPSVLCCIDESIRKLLPAAATCLKSKLKEKKVVKFIKYALGLVGTVIFQNVFRLTTFSHVRAFMYLATSWIANLSLINASDDFGVLNFLLGNMILGSTVNQSGLGITTWISYCVSLFLYILGIKLKSINITPNLETLPRPPITFWIFYICVSFDSLFYLICKQTSK